MRIHSAVAAMLLVAGAVACGDSNNPTSALLVSGTIQNNTGAPLPANTRVLIAWGVSSGTPDYSYVFGEGTIDAAAGTFQIQLDQPPPAMALNTGQLGVGLVFATTDQTISSGVLPGYLTEENVIGAAGRYGVIYIGSDASTEVRDWAAGFESGYNVGVGVDVENDFDRFAPTAPSGVVLIIDDLANIDFVNWT